MRNPTEIFLSMYYLSENYFITFVCFTRFDYFLEIILAILILRLISFYAHFIANFITIVVNFLVNVSVT